MNIWKIKIKHYKYVSTLVVLMIIKKLINKILINSGVSIEYWFIIVQLLLVLTLIYYISINFMYFMIKLILLEMLFKVFIELEHYMMMK